jgi:hypothetical protein
MISLSEDNLRKAAALHAQTSLQLGSLKNHKKTLKFICSEWLKPLLEADGFLVKSDFSFRVQNSIAHFIETTISPFSSALELSFGFDLGFCYGDFHPERLDKTRLLVEGMPIISRPIGALYGDVTWSYSISIDTDPKLLGKQLAADFEAIVLPWFRQLNSLEAIVRFLEQEDANNNNHRNKILLAMILTKAGRREEAAAFFRLSEGSQEQIVMLAKRYRILLN